MCRHRGKRGGCGSKLKGCATSGPPRCVRAAGGVALQSVGGGNVQIIFVAPRERLVRAPVATFRVPDNGLAIRCAVPEGVGLVQPYEGKSAWEVQVVASGRMTAWRRASRLPPIRTFDQLCARFGIHTEELARPLPKASEGVKLQGSWDPSSVPAAIYEGHSGGGRCIAAGRRLRRGLPLL